jgi:hypothetical protein
MALVMVVFTLPTLHGGLTRWSSVVFGVIVLLVVTGPLSLMYDDCLAPAHRRHIFARFGIVCGSCG